MDSTNHLGRTALLKGFKIGNWQVFPEQNCLKSMAHQESIPLVPKVMELLLYLVEHSGQVCAFEELHSALWPQEFVNDNALYNLVGQLRKALGDKASNPEYIETVSKKGYRFIAEVEAVLPKPTIAPPPPKTAPKYKYTAAAIAALLVIALSYLLLIPKNKSSSDIPALAKQQYALAEFQFNQGNVQQARVHAKQALAIDDSYPQPKVLLAFGYWSAALQAEESAEKVALAKQAQKLLDELKQLNPDSPDVNALQFLLTNPAATQLSNTEKVTKLLTNSSHRAKTSVARLQFQHGLTEQSEALLLAAQQQCLQCPYIYNLLARTQSVAGKSAVAFANFQQYLLLTNHNKPLDKASLGKLNFYHLKATSQWLKANPQAEVIDTAHRNSLVLFNLSLHKVSKAESLLNMTESAASQGFFTLYTKAALAGAKRQFSDAQQWLQLRSELYPDNQRFYISTLYANWLAGEPEKALQALNLYQSKSSTTLNRDNFNLYQLKAALLKETGQQHLAEQLLAQLLNFYQQKLLPMATEASIDYAELLAINGQEQQAVEEIELAIKQGWVEDFHQNWWSLAENPFFKSIRDTSKFKKLVTDYNTRIEAL